MGYLVYFIGYIIATCIILFVMDDDWKTEGVTIADWLVCSIFGSLSWALILGLLFICIIAFFTKLIDSSNILSIYLFKPKN